jgi:hypothetical protein
MNLKYLCLAFLIGSKALAAGDIALQPLPTLEKTLIGGTEVNGADWPVTVYSSQGNSRCSANVIGPQTLIIAAHCVGNGKSASFTLLDGKVYTSTCTHSPDYASDATADWALCKISNPVTGAAFEYVNTDSTKPKVGDTVRLMGYGCINSSGSGGNDGKLRSGEAKVTDVPNTRSNDIVTKGGAALCYGDSGGPAWLVDGAKRYQMSVNSRGDIRTMSYLSALAVAGFKDFATKWATTNSQKICGLHADTEGCRGATPPQDPLPEHCKVSLDKFTDCLYGNPRVALKDPTGCREAYSDLFACEEIAEREDDTVWRP